MIRPATAADVPALTRFLQYHTETSMFLLSNLEAHGLDETQHRHGTQYILIGATPDIEGVFAITNGGMMMCQIPDQPDRTIKTALARLAGRTTWGMTGEASQVARVLGHLDISCAEWQINKSEPLYRLKLSLLTRTDALTRKPTEADQPWLVDWFASYIKDAGLGSGNSVREDAHNQSTAAIRDGKLRLLLEDGTPVAMAGLNAQAGQTVQIGNVFTPQPLRGRGYAGKVVASLLQEMKCQGARVAILFAASPAAASAYVKIGFQRIGDYRVALLKSAKSLGGQS